MSWQSDVINILHCQSINLVDLARAANVDPRHLYRGADLTGVDIRGQDLTSLDLTSADLTNAIMDFSTLLDPSIDPRLSSGFVRKSIRIPRDLYVCLKVFEADQNYVYTGWAIKWLIERSYFASSYYSQSVQWSKWIEISRTGQAMISQPGGQHYSLKVRSDHYDALVSSYRHVGGANKAIRLALLVGIFDYFNISPGVVGSKSIINLIGSVPKSRHADAVYASLARSLAQDQL